nr:hypothetical protein [uncultured Prevotella sp.]
MQNRYHQFMSLMPLRMTEKQLILVVCLSRAGEATLKHPLMVRLEQQVLHQFARYFDLREMKDFRPTSSIDYNVWQGHLKAIIGYATNYEIDDFSRSEEESLSFIRGFVRKGSDSGFSYEDLKAVVDEHEQFLRSKK